MNKVDTPKFCFRKFLYNEAPTITNKRWNHPLRYRKNSFQSGILKAALLKSVDIRGACDFVIIAISILSSNDKHFFKYLILSCDS